MILRLDRLLSYHVWCQASRDPKDTSFQLSRRAPAAVEPDSSKDSDRLSATHFHTLNHACRSHVDFPAMNKSLPREWPVRVIDASSSFRGEETGYSVRARVGQQRSKRVPIPSACKRSPSLPPVSDIAESCRPAGIQARGYGKGYRGTGYGSVCHSLCIVSDWVVRGSTSHDKQGNSRSR